MSVLNQMLKDLELRQGQLPKHMGIPGGVQVVGHVPEKKSYAKWLLGFCLLLVAGAGAYYFLAPKTSTNTPPLTPTSETVPLSTSIIASATPTSIARAEEIPLPPPAEPSTSTVTTAPPVAVAARAPQPTLIKQQSPRLKEPTPPTPVKSEAPSLSSPVPESAVQKQTSSAQTVEFQYQQALEHLQNGQTADGINQLKAVLRDQPQHTAARRVLVSVLLNNRQTAEAEKILSEGSQQNPGDIDITLALARMQVERGNSAEALSTLQRNHAYGRNSGDYLAFEASLLQKKEEHAEAIKLLNQALAFKPDNGTWRVALASSQKALGQNIAAQENARRALNDPQLPAVLQALAQKLSQ